MNEYLATKVKVIYECIQRKSISNVIIGSVWKKFNLIKKYIWVWYSLGRNCFKLKSVLTAIYWM